MNKKKIKFKYNLTKPQNILTVCISFSLHRVRAITMTTSIYKQCLSLKNTSIHTVQYEIPNTGFNNQHLYKLAIKIYYMSSHDRTGSL